MLGAAPRCPLCTCSGPCLSPPAAQATSSVHPYSWVPADPLVHLQARASEDPQPHPVAVWGPGTTHLLSAPPTPEPMPPTGWQRALTSRERPADGRTAETQGVSSKAGETAVSMSKGIRTAAPPHTSPAQGSWVGRPFSQGAGLTWPVVGGQGLVLGPGSWREPQAECAVLRRQDATVPGHLARMLCVTVSMPVIHPFIHSLIHSFVQNPSQCYPGEGPARWRGSKPCVPVTGGRAASPSVHKESRVQRHCLTAAGSHSGKQGPSPRP